jgi:uncharacterized repeat protein (TIGR01451 family)
VVKTSTVQVAALTVDIRNGDNVIEVGAETTYEIRVLNQGTGPDTNVQVMAILPDGMEPRPAESLDAFRVAGRQIVFQPMARLDPGQEAMYRVRAACKRAGDWRFKIQLTSDQLRLPVCKEESIRIYSDR